jgi:catechol 2,3-dioxygenase-like lactoylglutathione lyase family enzyme
MANVGVHLRWGRSPGRGATTGPDNGPRRKLDQEVELRTGRSAPHGSITRREMLLSLPALSIASRAIAQSSKRQLPVKTLSHVTLSVSDPKRSIEFYQGLFGLPIQAYQGATDAAPPSLRIGPGPQFLFLSRVAANGTPGINHFCMTTPGFDVDRVTSILAEHDVNKAEGAGGGMTGGPMKMRIRIRDERTGGSKEGTAEMYIGDPDGIAVQLQDTSYCGGSGRMGEVCLAKPVPAPGKGLIAIQDLSHVTLFVSDAQRSRDFYQDLFAMPVQAHQGPATPLLGIGSNRQFLTIVGAGAGRAGAAPRAASINHACFTMENFNPDKVLKTLADFGVKARGDARGPAGPLVSYVTMRTEERGGAKGGTPELYFTDPDGILMQIQDVTYCGGSGSLGEICSG